MGIRLTFSMQSTACRAPQSRKQACNRYHDVAQIVAKHRWPDAIRALRTHPETKLNIIGANSRVGNDVGLKLWVHNHKAVGPGEKYGGDDESPAELRVDQSPRFPENTVQQRLIHTPEDPFLGEAGHDQEEGPALSVQSLTSPENEEDCGYGQSQEQSDDRRLQPTWPKARRHADRG